MAQILTASTLKIVEVAQGELSITEVCSVVIEDSSHVFLHAQGPRG